MKMKILKAIVSCTMVLSLLLVGVTTGATLKPGFTVRHDGPHNIAVVK